MFSRISNTYFLQCVGFQPGKRKQIVKTSQHRATHTHRNGLGQANWIINCNTNDFQNNLTSFG